ncbi:hypothetical protein ACI6Q5_05035 [Xanthomonas codiaei]|uniref:Uncharacterized protein n=1 Tax=Xanthomonas codiaei TaxID=56463 RepID=A0ABW9MJ62_9XANT|nr:hypothetical protein [Xanthomonas codiaei]
MPMRPHPALRATFSHAWEKGQAPGCGDDRWPARPLRRPIARAFLACIRFAVCCLLFAVAKIIGKKKAGRSPLYQ